MEKIDKNNFVELKPGESSSGSRLYYEVDYKYDEEAKCHVPYFKEPVDMYQMIQAAKSSVDISTIVNRATLGDLTVLHIGEKPYADVADIPDNLNDLNAFNTQAINNFSKLDPNLRKLFDNDVYKFINAVKDGSYTDIINNAFKPKEETPKQEEKGSAE